MVIGICSICGKPSPQSMYCFSEWCSCNKTNKEWIEFYKQRRWNLNEDQAKLLRGEKIDIALVKNYIDWPKKQLKLKYIYEKYISENKNG